MKWSARIFVGFVFCIFFPVHLSTGQANSGLEELGIGSDGQLLNQASIPSSASATKDNSPSAPAANGQSGEFIFGVGEGTVYLTYVDSLGQNAKSAKLQNAPKVSLLAYIGFNAWDSNRMYGASDSDSNEYFWGTNLAPYPPYYPISSLQKIYPAESAVYQIGSGYIQNPGDPNIYELGYDEDAGILYGTNYGKLYSIDPSLGTAGYIGDFGSGFDGQPIEQAWSMDYDPNIGELVMIDQVTDESRVYHSAQTYYADRNSGAAGYVGDTGQERLTDIYYSVLHNQVYACANYPHRFCRVNTRTGAVTEMNPIGHNILGLGGEFAESEGVTVGGTYFSNQVKVSAYSEHGIARDEDSDAAGGGFPFATAAAFVQETGAAPDVGQSASMEANANFQVVSGHGILNCQVNFNTSYNGTNQRGQGGGQAKINMTGRLNIGTNSPYPSGSRGLILIADGNRFLHEDVSRYVTEWRLKIYDPDNPDKSVIYLSEEDVPQIMDAPLMGAAYVLAGESLYYEFQAELDIQHLQADVNCDGIVNQGDYSVIALWWPYDQCGPLNLNCEHCDMEPDGDVDFSDLVLMQDEWLLGKKVDSDNALEFSFGFEFRTVEAPRYSGAQPLNDECANAIPVVTDHRYLGTSIGATESPGGDISSCGYNDRYDVWYKFEPTEKGLYSIESHGWGFTTYISVFDGCDGAEIPDMCQPEYGNMFFEVTSLPQTYFIRIAGYNYGTGNFDLTVNHYQQPENDDCAGAREVTDDDCYECHTYGATGADSSSCGDGDTKDVWFQYTPTEDGAAVFNTFDSWDYKDMTIALYDSCSGPELACAATQECEIGDPYTAIPYNVEAGQTYYIRVAFNSGETGRFDFFIDTYPIAPNDQCANATVVEAYESYWDESTYGATGDITSSCGTDDYRDVWYEYTAPNDEFVLFTVYRYECSPQFTLSLYNACDGAEVDCVLSEESEMEGEPTAEIGLNAAMGQTYYLRVAFNEYWMDSFQLEVMVFEPPYNDECSEAVEIEWLDNWDEGSTYGATASGVNYQCYDDLKDVWYSYTATADDDGKELYFHVENWEGENYPTLALFASCSASDPLAYDCGSCYTGSEVGYAVSEGVTYYIRIAYEENKMGEFVVNISEDSYCF